MTTNVTITRQETVLTVTAPNVINLSVVPRTTSLTISNEQGPQGATGPQGPTGATGPQGPSGVVSVSSPITNTGTSTAANIGIDQTLLSIAQSQVTNLTTDLAAKAPLASPALSGTPTAPTAAVDTNSTQVATTAYVVGQGYLKSATASSTYAPLASPTFTGDPKAPTPTSTDNDTSIATTAFVQAQKVSPALTGTPTAPTAPIGASSTQLATTEFVDEATNDMRQFAAAGSVLQNVPARVHPAEQLLKQAVFWIDADHSSASGQTISNLGWGGSVLNATAGSSGSADSNDPKFLGWDGTNYVYLPGVNGNALTVPDDNTFTVTGDFDIQFRMSRDTWTALGTLADKTISSTSGCYQIYTSNLGHVTVSFRDSANTAWLVSDATNSTAVPFTAGTTGWIRVTRVSSTGVITIYTAPDSTTAPTSWTQLGNTISSTAGNIASVSSTLTVGQIRASIYPMAGKVYRTILKDGIDGTTVLDVDTSLVSSGSATTFTALTGQTVTINRSTSGRKSVAVTSPCYLLGTDDYFEVNNRWIDGTTKNVYLPGVADNNMTIPDNAAWDVVGDIDIRARVALDDWTPATAQAILTRRGSSSSWSYSLSIQPTGVIRLATSADGSNLINADSTVAPTVSDGGTLWIRAVRDLDNGSGGNTTTFYTSNDGSTWTQLGNTVVNSGTTSIFASTQGLRIGDIASNSTMFAGRIYRVQMLDGVTTVLDVDTSVVTSVSQTTFTESSTNAATVTINKSGTGYVSTPIVRSGYVLPTGTSNLTPASFSLLDFGATDSFSVVAVIRQPSFTASKAILSKSQWTYSKVGYTISRASTASGVYFTISDGTNHPYTANATQTAGTLTTFVGVRDTVADIIALYQNGTLVSSVTDTTTGTLANTYGVRVGTENSGAYNDMENTAVAIFRRALTASEITTLSNYFTGRAA